MRFLRAWNREAGLVNHREGHEGNVVPVSGDGGAVRLEHEPAGLAGSFYGVGGPSLAVLVGDDLEFAGFIFHIIPANAIGGLAVQPGVVRGVKNLLLPAQGFAVEEKFRFVAGSIDVDRRDLADAVGPVPVLRQDVRQGMIGTPMGLVEIKAVLRKAGQVNNAEIGRTRWVVSAAPRRWLADIIKTGPDKFAGDGRAVVLAEKFMIGRSGPARMI